MNRPATPEHPVRLRSPRVLIRDNDNKFGATFQNLADGAGIEILRTPFRAPRANAFCERFLGSLRREFLDTS